MNNEEPILNKAELYDLYPIITALNNAITQYGGNYIPDKVITDLKKELNGLFKSDPVCDMLFISNNTDKEFFGVFIKPAMDASVIVKCPDLRDMPVVKKYSIDIDSKLFSIGLSARQIISLIIYDIYKIMDIESFRDIATVMDAISAGKDNVISNSMIQYDCIKKLTEYCMCDYLYRSRSIFTTGNSELVRVPELLQAYELDSEFVESLEIIATVKSSMYNEIPSPALSLNWVYNVINNYEPRSTYAIHVLKSGVATTGSTMIKNVLNSIIARFTSTNIKSQKENIVGVKEGSLFAGIRKNGLKSLENDLYEYEMRIKNVDDENSAIFLMRQINSRMGVIADYLDEEKLSDSERRRWENLYDRYDKMRAKMTSKPVYSRKMYGLFVDYNALMQPGNDNSMTMNTMY